MVIQLRKNRLVKKMLVNTRGQIKTDQVKLPPNTLSVTGVHVVAQLLQVAPQGAIPRYYFGTSSDTSPTPNMVTALPTNTFDGVSVDVTGNAGAGEYFYYAHPIWLTDPKFNYGGFQGGFLNMDVEDLNTPEGVQTFRVWRSTNANLGNTTIHIVH